MQPSRTWKQEGNRYSVHLIASQKAQIQIDIEAREGHNFNFIEAEVIAWQTMLEIMEGKRPPVGGMTRYTPRT